MTKTKRALLVVLAVACVFIMSGTAHGQVPAPGWQCMPYAGVADYTVASCSGYAPVFVYVGDGQSALAYFLLTIPEGAGNDCFSEPGWSPGPVELGAQPLSGVGANTLTGESLYLAATPGMPADQACLDSLRVPWPLVRLSAKRLGDHLVLVTAEPLPALK